MTDTMMIPILHWLPFLALASFMASSFVDLGGAGPDDQLFPLVLHIKIHYRFFLIWHFINLELIYQIEKFELYVCKNSLEGFNIFEFIRNPTTKVVVFNIPAIDHQLDKILHWSVIYRKDQMDRCSFFMKDKCSSIQLIYRFCSGRFARILMLPVN